MKITILSAIATLMLITSAFLTSGCATANAQPAQQTNFTAKSELTEIQKRKIETARQEFPQEGNVISLTGRKHYDYEEVKIEKLHGTVRILYLWINDDMKYYDRPYTNDGTPIKVPGVDVPMSINPDDSKESEGAGK